MKTLLVFAFIQANLHLTFADWQHPHYSYRCLENGDVVLFGVHNNSNIYVDGSTNTCQTIKNGTGVYVIKFKCLTRGVTANISVYDYVFDGRSESPPTPTTTIAPSIVGGHGGHKFVITCKNIPDAGINRTVAHVFQEKISKNLPVNVKEVGAVEMHFKAVKNWATPDISAIYIGDEFYMFIKYMGAQLYSVIPEECKAFDEPLISKGFQYDPNHMVKLWNIKDFGSSCNKYPSLLQRFGRSNETLIYAKMYGFRFTGQNYVTITCRVKIYNSTSIRVADDENLCGDITASSRRRKRNIENVPFQTQSVTKKLRVFDDKDLHLAENNSQRIKWGISLWMMIFATATLHT